MVSKKLKGMLLALAVVGVVTTGASSVYAAQSSFNDSTASSTDGENFSAGKDESQNKVGNMTDHTFGGGTSTPTDSTTQTVSVYATKASSAQIKVPQVLVGDATHSKYLVGVKGDITSKQSISVAPTSSTFKLTDVHDNSRNVTANISQTKSDWSYADLASDNWVYSEGTITYNQLEAGSYNGVFNLAVNLNYAE